MTAGEELTVFDSENVEVLKLFVTLESQNGNSWAVMYCEVLNSLIKNAPDFSMLKIFLALSVKQEYKSGINTTKQAVAR